MMRARFGAAIVVVVAAATMSACADDDSGTLPPDVAIVERVIDGDTIDVEIGGRDERVRMIGIDTPELHPDTGTAECMAAEARDFTAAHLPPGTEVRLERDVVGRDDYGRLLAYVFRRGDDVLVNELIVADGYARPLTIAPNDTYRQRFVAAASTADAAGLGVWSTCAG